jgi:Tol biopolymer transport system component/imidazolonepropionase-like amidohydrolase
LALARPDKLTILVEVFHISERRRMKRRFQCFFALCLLASIARAAVPDSSWDITASHGPAVDISFETDEGTWMSVDVSPDGRTILFDLLGDIYTLPVEGGEAKLLRGGPSFDTQPRFSPDGRFISFTSDREGGDNIWVMNSDGSNAHSITSEKVRLVNNAVWTPDGQYLVARKHFVNTRSLGSGEMWMYHRTGGEGLQLTKKRDWQHDAGEPSISPDGRYLYYSQDISPGSSFEYNRDPYGTIYAIDRLDMHTGTTERFVGGPGGAVRPQISPDGKWLAFVRRVGLGSVLFVHNVETGEEWPLFDGLSKDSQETWSIFGVYPGFAWTRDGKFIILSGRGKLWKVDVASKHAVNIPFKVRVQQRLTSALRFPQQVAPETFRAKMIRWPVVTADRRFVVFTALGHLYRKLLPDGEPRRVTSDRQFEYYPSLSPDGKWIVYTAWTDSGKGAIFKVRTSGGSGIRLTNEKGTFIEPSFSGNGSRIVFRKIGGDALRGGAYSHGLGVYWMEADGGPMHFVTEEGSIPRWLPGEERISVVSSEAENRALVSVDMLGGNRRVHLVSDNAQEIVPSPDGKWIAFVERFNAYVAPFPETGQPLHLGPAMSQLPVRKISKDAGSYLQWSSDCSALYWTLGPTLHSMNLRSAFTFLNTDDHVNVGSDTSAVDLSFPVRHDAPSETTVLKGATVISMRGDEVLKNGTIVVRGNRILAIGPSGEVDVPAGARVVDVAGKFIMPGIVDVHAHGPAGSQGIIPEQNWAFYASLAFGVTTEHDPSNDTYEVFSSSEMIKAGEIIGPRLFSTGTILYGAEGSFKAVVNSLDDARAHLRRLQAAGAFSVKSYNQPRREQRQQILQAARELRMEVVPEGGSTLFWNLTQILDGHTGIEHCLPVEFHNDVATLFAKSDVGYTPTLIVAYGGLFGENYWYAHSDVWENSRLLKFVPRGIVDSRSRRRMTAADDDWNHILASQGAKRILDAGGHVQLGAHGQLQGLGAHWELWNLTQGGMTPMQAIRAATLDGARYLGLDGDIGSLAPGKLADLLVLEKNPLDDIHNSTSISLVMSNGRLFDASTMSELGGKQRTCNPFYWQNGRQGEVNVDAADTD